MRSVRHVLARLLAAATVSTVLVPLSPATPAAALTNAVPGGVAHVTGEGVGDNGPATGALVRPEGLAYAPDGDLVVAEHYRVRRIDSVTGVITTIAGTGVSGFSGDGGQATAATFNAIADVAVDATGAVVVADRLNARVRRIGTDGVVTTIVADLAVTSVAFSVLGDLYVADLRHVHRVTGGGLELIAGGPNGSTYDDYVIDARDAYLDNVVDIAFTTNGHLLIAEQSRRAVRRVTDGLPDNPIDLVAGGDAAPLHGLNDLAVTPANVAVIGLASNGVRLLANPSAQAAGPLTTLDQGSQTCGIVVAASASGVVAGCLTTTLPRIRSLPGDGTAPLVAGADRSPDGTAAAEAFFDDIRGVTRAADGTVYLVTGRLVRSIGTDGLVHTVDATFDQPNAIAAGPDGSVYVGDGAFVLRIAPGGDVEAFAGGPNEVVDGAPAVGTRLGPDLTLAVDSTGVVYIGFGCAVVRVTTDGLAHPVALPSCSGVNGGDLAIDGDDRLVYSRTVGDWAANVYRIGADGTSTHVDAGSYGRGVAVLPSGSVETAGASLRADGSRFAQRYVWQGVEMDWLRLVAEPAGTLLGWEGRRVLRLTPATQTLAPAVTGLQATTGPGTITLSWDASGSAELTSYAVRLSPGTVAPAGPTVGTTGTVVSATSVTFTRGHPNEAYPGLRNEPYTIAVFAMSPGGSAVPAVVTVTPPADTTPPGSGSGLTTSLANGLLTVEWVRPTDADLYITSARMSLSGTPATPAGGTPPIQHLSSATKAVWAAQAEGTYSVAVFHDDIYGNVSAPLTASVVIDTTAPAAVTGLAVALVNGRVRATWNAPPADAAQVRARALLGSSYPSSPAQGGVPVASTPTSAEWTVGQYGTTFRIAVFTTDAAGNTGAPATAAFVPRWPSALSMTTSATTVTYGAKVTVRGTLTKAGTTTGFGAQRVELWGRRRGYGSFGYLGALNTDAYGRVAFAHLTPMDFEYQLRHPATAVAAVTSATRTVWVKANVTATPSGVNLSRTSTLYVTGAIGPKHVGVPLTLQRFYGGAWHDVATLRTDSYSRVRFAQRPGVRGTYYYRVVFRGDAEHRPSWSPTVIVAVS